MQKLFIGTYCHGGEDSLFTAVFDEAAGRLFIKGGCAAVDDPSYLAKGKSGTLYAVSEADGFSGIKNSGGIAALKEEADALQLFAAEPTSGAAPCHLLLNADESMLYVSNYMGGSISVFETEPALRLTQTIPHLGSGPNKKRQESAHVHFCSFVGERLFAVDLGLDALKCYRPFESTLVPDEACDILLPKGSGPRHFVLSKLYPNTLFIVCELSNEVMMVDISTPGGTLLQTLSTLPAPCNSTCAAIKQSADGRFIFVSNRGHDSIAVFKLTENKREIALCDIVKCEGRTPRDFLVLDNHVLVCNQDSDDITLFTFDSKSGKLSFTGERIPVKKPVCIISAT